MIKAGVSKQILVGLSLVSGLFAGPALADCALLPEASLRQAVKDIASLEQLSQTSETCQYQWPKPDQEQRRLQNEQLLRESMKMGANAYTPLPLWNEVRVEILASFENAEAASAMFNRYLSQQLPSKYGSPDPLQGVALSKLQGAGPPKAWNKAQRQMLVQLGNRLLMMNVQVEDDLEKNQALAYILADKLK